MLAAWPPGRRIAVSAVVSLCVAVAILTATRGLSASLPFRLVQILASAALIVVVLGVVVAAVTGRLADYRDPADEEEFERLLERSERLAEQNLAAEPEEGDFFGRDPYDPVDFEILVREALDDLPDLLLRSLDHVAVVVSDEGRRHRAYGLYQGGTVAGEVGHDRIVIFRDTLLRDFGGDPDELRAEVTRTVRHELAHHLGADELGVRDLGL
jgi:predicted Zn-dependent protease with MMP-like domain